MQAKISAFFKPSTPESPDPPRLSDNVESKAKMEQEILITYKRRRTPKNNLFNDGDEPGEMDDGLMGKTQIDCDSKSADHLVDSLVRSSSIGRNAKKKRSYAQYHLNLGQSDFLLQTCSTCGLKYACGDQGDEKVHKAFHKNYHQGIQFKGWRIERVVSMPFSNGDRIVLVLDDDPSAQKHKVQEVVKMMERELGLSDGWILHKLCKVYLFISSQRVIGCLVAEPIRTAHRVISTAMVGTNAEAAKSIPTISDGTITKAAKSNSTILQFGVVSFQREVIKKAPSINNLEMIERGTKCAVQCEREPVAALCGIRAIWVVSSHRRKHIATRLLDVLRKSFFMGYVLEPFQCAFSQPTSVGKALATRFSGTDSFLVYNTGIQDC